MKADITNFEDIVWFVDSFYQKVQSDELIGPVFDSVIVDWEPHLEKMYKFWNAALFGIQGFRGNPFARHAPLSLKKGHFERWLLLFNKTIDEQYEGTMANETKRRANMMAEMFLNRIQNMNGGHNRVIV
ncbi:group III truncated hemoglobin [Pedobacter sp. ASV1-7]|uniref:group III truncated hemoglobin n=1 Tax=Pedobacter sp. ASV1-7 TaxID=3145237 RepID=UPI0032E8D623